MRFSANYFNKVIALVVSVCMVVAYLPIVETNADYSVYVNDEVYTTPTPSVSDINSTVLDTELGEEGPNETVVLREDINLRDEVTKYFEMSDGSMKACVYPQAVHYMKDGVYEEIDNTLELVEVDNSLEIEVEANVSDVTDEDEIVEIQIETEEPIATDEIMVEEETIITEEPMTIERVADQDEVSEETDNINSDNSSNTTSAPIEGKDAEIISEELNSLEEEITDETDNPKGVEVVQENEKLIKTEEVFETYIPTVTDEVLETVLPTELVETITIEEAEIKDVKEEDNNKHGKKKNKNKNKPERKGSYYKNKSNGFTVMLPEEYGTDYTEFTDENGFVSFKLVGANKKSIKKDDKKSMDKDDKTIARNVNDKGTYKSIKNNVDLEYDVTGNMLKETIVLNKKTKEDFTFEVKTSADSATLNEDGSISFYDENNNKLYEVSAPFMSDAKAEYSKSIEVGFEATEEGYLLTYKPDEEWLYDKERAYPVKIDPTMFKALDEENIIDTYVGSYQNDNVPDIWGATDVLIVGQEADGNRHTMRSMIKFDIPSAIGENDRIVDAKLSLVHYPDDQVDAKITDGIQIDIHELTGAFTESGTYWENKPAYDSTIIDYAIVDTERYFTDTEISYDSYNITELANKWHNGSANYGLLLKYHEEDYEPVDSDDHREVLYFAKQSRYYGDVTKYVEITYRNAVGLEDYWTYANYNVGRAGNSYINVYNGNHVFVHNDVSNNTIINSFTLSHVYNSALQVSDDADSDIEMYGEGWRLSLVHRLLPANIPGNSSVKYVYTDGDGTKHYIVETEDGSKVDEDGLGLTYTDCESGSAYSCKLETKDDTVLYFDSAGYMTRIEDSNENYINLSFETITDDSKRLKSIITSSGDEYTLSYDSLSQLDYIIDKADRITYYNYDSYNRLTSIEYPDDSISSFTYIDNVLRSVAEPGGCKMFYVCDYSKGKSLAVSNHSNNNITGGVNTFTYDYCQTKIADNDGYVSTYQFDTAGRCTGIFDNKGNICSYTFTEDSTDSEGIFANNKTAIESNGAIYTENLLKNGTFVEGTDNWGLGNGDITEDTTNTLITPTTIKIENSSITTSVIYQMLGGMNSGSYTLSAYVKGNVTGGLSTGGIGVKIKTGTDDDGDGEYTENRSFISEMIRSTDDVITDNGFTKVSTSVTLLEGEVMYSVEAGLFGASGTAYIDSIQLEKGTTAGPINLIQNSSFETSSGGSIFPYRFSRNSSMAGGRYTVAALDNTIGDGGSYGYKISGSSEYEFNAYQPIAISGTKGDTYSFGCWAKGLSVQPHDDNNPFAMKLTFQNNGAVTEEKYINFNTALNEWQFAKDTIITSYDYDNIKVSFEYNNNENYAYFDCAFLYKDTAGSYRYDNNGNVISTTDFAKQQSEYQYSDNNLSKLVDPVGTGYEYFYDNKNNLIGSKSSEGTQNIYDYGDYGNVSKVRITADDYSAALQANETYYIRLKGSGKYLTADGSSSLSNVSQQTFTGTSNQKWTLKQTTDGYYIIQPGNSLDKCIDIASGSDDEEASVIIYAKYASETEVNQKFKLEPNSDYTYRIEPQSSTTGKKLTVKSYTSETDVCLSAGAGADSYSWYFEKADTAPVTSIESGKVYRIRAYHSGRYMDVKGALTASGTKLQQYQLNHGENQYFYITRYAGTSYYQIRPISTDIFVAMSTGTSTVNPNYYYLNLSNTTVIDNSLFKLVYDTTGNKGFQIIPKIDQTKALEVVGGSLSNSVELVFDTLGTENHSYFIFEECSKEMVSEAEYTDDGNHLASITNVHGGETVYSYNEYTDLLDDVTDPLGNFTQYEYNPKNDRLLSVSVDDSKVEYSYLTNGTLDTITSPSHTLYKFNYDTFGRTTSTSVGGRTLGSYTYKNNNSSIVSRFDYGNGAYLTYEYDELNRLTKSTRSDTGYGSNSKTYTYDKLGKIAKIKDFNLTTNYNYDLTGRLTNLSDSDGYKLEYVYDEYNRVKSQSYTGKQGTIKTTYGYGNNTVDGQKTGLIYSVGFSSRRTLSYEYDDLNRKTSRVHKGNGLDVRKDYKYTGGAGTNTTTTLVSEEELYIGGIFEYSNQYYYDEIGNLRRIDLDYDTVSYYAYDDLGQLISSATGSMMYDYSYDNSGNILSVKENNNVIKSYTYGNTNWPDLLTAFNGNPITYDEIGNPLQYRDGMSFDWGYGRQLKNVETDDLYISYGYDADGYRNVKIDQTSSTIVTNYKYIDGVLMSEKTGTEEIIYLYDENGVIAGFSVIDDTGVADDYYYILNIMGDVTGIVDEYGSMIVQYTYDDWGNVTSITGSKATTIGQKNPIRYRGYYYDSETGFYYLGSRYYDPVTGRFINVDGYVSTGTGLLGYNMFAYCGNNPIMNCDKNGATWYPSGSFFVNLPSYTGVTKKKSTTTDNSNDNFFGAEATLETTTNTSKSTSEMYPIVVETGVTTSTVVSQKGNSSNPVSFYANGVTNHPLSSTAGIKLNISDVSFSSSLGLDNMGFTRSDVSGNQSRNQYFGLSIIDLQLSYEVSESIIIGDTTTTTYTKVSVNGKFIAAACLVAVLISQGAPTESLRPILNGG